MESIEHAELDLRQLLGVIRKRIWTILSLTGAATITAALLSFFYLTPIYEASTQLLVNKSDKNQQTLYSLNDINADMKLAETYSVIIKSPRIMDLVIQQMGLTISYEKLTDKVKVSPVKNSQVISITVSDESEAKAARIANSIVDVFKKEIVSIMNVDNVQVLTIAKPDPVPIPVKPKPVLNTAIAFVIGVMAGVALAFLLEYLDTSIKTEQDVEQFLNLPVLGSIPKIEHNLRSDAKFRPSVNSTALASMEAAAGSEENEKN